MELEIEKVLGGQVPEKGQKGEKSQICTLFSFNICANSPNIHIHETLENTEKARRDYRSRERNHTLVK